MLDAWLGAWLRREPWLGCRRHRRLLRLHAQVPEIVDHSGSGNERAEKQGKSPPHRRLGRPEERAIVSRDLEIRSFHRFASTGAAPYPLPLDALIDAEHRLDRERATRQARCPQAGGGRRPRGGQPSTL